MRTAAELFHACGCQEEYETLPQRLEQALGDPTLAEECYSFLPEICAENAFDTLACSEMVEIQAGDAPVLTCYKNQLADYWPMHSALFALFEEGAFGGEANAIYQEYIGASSIYNVVRQIEESDGNLKDCRLTSLRFQFSSHFEIR